MTLSVRCFHLRSSMCRTSEIDGRCVHLRGSDRCEISYAATLTRSMCRSTFEDPIGVNFIIMLLYSCMRITPRVCTLVLFIILVSLLLQALINAAYNVETRLCRYPPTFDVGLIQLSFHTVCSPNTCKGDFNPNVTFQLGQIALRACTLLLFIVINPRRACAERVTVVVSCVCVSVCLSVCLSVCMSVRTRYSGSTRN